MLNAWNNAVITEINLAMYVSPETKKNDHTDRSFHGLVMNDGTSDKKIYFGDGTVLASGPHDVHYFPKHADYHVHHLTTGGCWAINFDLLEGLHQRPFNVHFQNPEPIRKEFKEAVHQYTARPAMCDATIRKLLYSMLVRLQSEQNKKYIPSGTKALILPAVNKINEEYLENNLSVSQLAALCGISEAYFRRIFTDLYGMSPVQYIKNMKLKRAEELLHSGLYAVSEVCFLSGFGDECYFSREFKKHFGLSPKAYEKTSR